tara:strand:+ start:246 stop:548 length:303 start_codon:yes stop_codon:yes gene_type:complete
MANNPEFSERAYHDTQTFLLEFPSRNNNLVSNEQIKDLVAMFRIMRTDSIEPLNWPDQEGEYEDMRRTYWVLRNAQKSNDVSNVKKVLEMSDIRALRKIT